MGTGGEVANALVCKTSIRRFNPGPVLQSSPFSRQSLEGHMTGHQIRGAGHMLMKRVKRTEQRLASGRGYGWGRATLEPYARAPMLGV